MKAVQQADGKTVAATSFEQDDVLIYPGIYDKNGK
ncbi:hypothetical protein HNQ08_004327 [Deinococcus humi]|uniref:Uncharacterized protein n=1 Tax=Deinococcus humi TaxID=662880 RepID=A0A7W8NG85_9DEIO|nr:hypothetical protein [Deinococcus humi]